jgi:hypothetical protein
LNDEAFAVDLMEQHKANGLVFSLLNLHFHSNESVLRPLYIDKRLSTV